MWYFHIVMCYLVFFAGIAAMLARLFPPLKFLHPYFGYSYIMFMLINTGSSLVIHNQGLPPAVLVSFIWVIGGLCLAWIMIIVHKKLFQSKLLEKVDAKVRSEGLGKESLQEVMAMETQKILLEQNWKQRLFSWKTVRVFVVCWCVLFNRSRSDPRLVHVHFLDQHLWANLCLQSSNRIVFCVFSVADSLFAVWVQVLHGACLQTNLRQRFVCPLF